MKQNLSASLEDYLEAIAQLIAVDGHAHTKEIAEKLNVKMPSVTGALRQLEKLGFIVYNAHYPVVLTEKGALVAEEVMRRHDILKTFFASVLGLSPEKASATACHLEHVVDSDIIERFILFSKAIEQRSDARSLQSFLSERMQFLSDPEKSTYIPLAEMEEGAVGTVMQFRAGFSCSSPEIKEGDWILCKGISEQDPEEFRVIRDGRELPIPLRIAENLWIKPR